MTELAESRLLSKILRCVRVDLWEIHLCELHDAVYVEGGVDAAILAVPLQVVILVYVQPVPVVCHNLQHRDSCQLEVQMLSFLVRLAACSRTGKRMVGTS